MYCIVQSRDVAVLLHMRTQHIHFKLKDPGSQRDSDEAVRPQPMMNTLLPW